MKLRIKVKKATLVVAGSILLAVFSFAFLEKKVFKPPQVGEYDAMINRAVYTERLNKLMTNWLTYGRGETGLFYIWMDASTNKPKPGLSQVSHSKIPYEADTEEFKIPMALWYMYILTGNKSYLDACHSNSLGSNSRHGESWFFAILSRDHVDAPDHSIHQKEYLSRSKRI